MLRRWSGQEQLVLFAVWSVLALVGVNVAQGHVVEGAARASTAITSLITQLPELRLDWFAAQFSSYDRSGGNHDWSDERTGYRGYLYKDENGDCVLAEVHGRGELTRLWFTGVDRVGNIRIYLDNESKPVYDLSVHELFSGMEPPFVEPWVYNDRQSSGGFVSYVVLPFARYFKLATTGEPSYYHVGVLRVSQPAIANAKAVTPGPTLSSLDFAPAYFTSNIANTTTQDALRMTTHAGELTVAPGEAAVLVDIPGPASLRRLSFVLPGLTMMEPSTTVHDDGRAFTGSSEFTGKVDPQNDGVRLVRRLDYGIGDQTARVYADGTLVGTWSTPGRDAGYNWLDATFDIPAALTRGKSEVHILIEFVSSQVDWNEFYYWIYSLYSTDSEPALTDAVDVGNPASEAAHGYRITGGKWGGDRSYQYPPENDGNAEQLNASLWVLENLWLEATWDDAAEAAVRSSFSLFFATSVGPHPVDSALIQAKAVTNEGNSGIKLTSLFPMPFAERARLVLRNTGAVPVTVRYAAEVAEDTNVTDALSKGNIGYFHATYHQEKPTRPGRDYSILEVGGAGKLVGVSMKLTGPRNRGYLEGDERISIDGNSSPIIHGTGTEDHFGGGWYFNRGPFTLLFHGAPGHIVRDAVDFTTLYGEDITSVYRFFVVDPVPFRAGIRYTIEHGAQNDVVTSYESVAFWYGLPGDALDLTDQFRPGEAAEASSHGFSAKRPVLRPLTGTFTGPDDRKTLSNSGVYHSGKAAFTLRVAPVNMGVVLRRRLDQSRGAQKALVRVDGQEVGIWLDPGTNVAHLSPSRISSSPAGLPPASRCC